MAPFDFPSKPISLVGKVRPNAIEKSSPKPIPVIFFFESYLTLVGTKRGYISSRPS